MGAWGAMIMSFFGSVFAALTLSIALGWSGVTRFAPFLEFEVLAAIAAALLRRPGASPTLSKQGEKVIMWSSIGEGVGLFIVGNLVTNLGHPEWLLPAMASVVGLHFLPMARWIPFWPFGVLGVCLLAAAVVGFALSATIGPAIAGLSAAAMLWVAAGLALRREARSRATPS